MAAGISVWLPRVLLRSRETSGVRASEGGGRSALKIFQCCLLLFLWSKRILFWNLLFSAKKQESPHPCPQTEADQGIAPPPPKQSQGRACRKSVQRGLGLRGSEMLRV